MSWDEYFMRHVYLAASKSKDPRTQVGAVLVRDRVILSEGYNGFPRGVTDDGRLQDRSAKLPRIVHAEHNAVLNAARNGICTLDTVLYTNGTPCNECAKAVIQAGVKEIVTHAPWEEAWTSREGWKESHQIAVEMIADAKVKTRSISTLLGLNSLCDSRLLNI